jgi:hypothetical protein
MHRYIRHILEKRKFINVYVFDKKLMKKFIVAKRDQPIKLEINDFIELFIKKLYI